MATYYVSATTGNDANNGTSAATAKASIGAGENLATSAGDIVYIAPGNYRESVLHGYSGTAADRIYFIGDPDCQQFPGVDQGIVRITKAADTTEFADDTYGTYCVYTNGRDYITWKNVHVDGVSGGINAYNDNNIAYGFRALAESDQLETINCLAQNIYYGFQNMYRAINSHAVCCYVGFINGVLHDGCTAFGCYQGVSGGDIHVNGIYGGAFYACNGVDLLQNCMTLHGYYSVLGTSADMSKNNLHVGGNFTLAAFNTNASSNQTFSGSYVTGCGMVGRYGRAHGIGFGFVRNQWSNNTDPIVGKQGSTDMQGDGLLHDQKGMVLWSINDMNQMVEAFKPSLFNKPLRGCTNPDDETISSIQSTGTDILGHPRIMGQQLDMFSEAPNGNNATSSRDIGPWEFSSVYPTGSASGSSPAVAIGDEGVFVIPVSVSASSGITASIFIKHMSGSAHPDVAEQPQFILRYSEQYPTSSATSTITTTAANQYQTGSALYLQVETLAANNNEWGELSVSHSFESNREVELVVYNRQSGSSYDGAFPTGSQALPADASITIISDIEIT